MFPNLPSLKVGKISIDKEDRLVCYTDGLTEIPDHKGNQLEAEGVANLLIGTIGLNEIFQKLNQLVEESKGEDGLSDDITFLAAQFL